MKNSNEPNRTRRSLLNCLFWAVPVSLMFPALVLAASITLTKGAKTNGYEVKGTSGGWYLYAKGTHPEKGAHLNGTYEITVCLKDGTTVTEKVEFTDGNSKGVKIGGRNSAEPEIKEVTVDVP
ncbi:MAG: hypothetical protein HY774_01015 [Acidobacteria bacterium]|nr:hypothetical protein [Acidobacteriota bacterium]